MWTADMLTDSVWRDAEDGDAGISVVVVEEDVGLLLAGWGCTAVGAECVGGRGLAELETG